MFQIGEFSKIARVTTRMLRHYDKLGLLTPDKIDEQTGYRYYSAQQLPRLNRIIALKDLGLTLDQIGRLLEESISADEIRGMLMMKKAEIEQTLADEVERLRSVESRLVQVEQEGVLPDVEVILKSVPKKRLLAVREICHNGLPDALALFKEITMALPAHVDQNILGQFVALSHSETFLSKDIDVEIGVFIEDQDYEGEVNLPGGETMVLRELPAVELMATMIAVGAPDKRHIGYGNLGLWAEANGYAIVGNEREIIIEPPLPGREEEGVVEIQLPVKKIEEESIRLLP
ncbi:MAG: MerR family transcriptional regulator [Chloroflexi bacterium]|nr:MerR family transcriptional regulator [Chloroflexota bacterium]